MKRYLCIDGGTTNTRLVLVEDGCAVDRCRISAGAGNTERAQMAVLLHDAIDELLKKHGLQESDITAIIASGMITSDRGLCELKHIPAPAGIAELHEAMHAENMPVVSSLPIHFIRGVRMCGDSPETIDMMRGEETELIGIMSALGAMGRNSICVLPGSHSKLIRTDEKGRISVFSTMLTGEMMAALAKNTILRDAVDLSFVDTEAEPLIRGYEYAKSRGINEAMFKVRVLKNMLGATPCACYSFFMGAVLQAEIDCILAADAQTVIIGGKRAFREPMQTLLARYTDAEIRCVEDAVSDSAAPLGMIRVFEYAAE